MHARRNRTLYHNSKRKNRVINLRSACPFPAALPSFQAVACCCPVQRLLAVNRGYSSSSILSSRESATHCCNCDSLISRVDTKCILPFCCPSTAIGVCFGLENEKKARGENEKSYQKRAQMWNIPTTSKRVPLGKPFAATGIIRRYIAFECRTSFCASFFCRNLKTKKHTNSVQFPTECTSHAYICTMASRGTRTDRCICCKLRYNKE